MGIWGSEYEGGSGREGFRDESVRRMKDGKSVRSCVTDIEKEMQWNSP